MGCVIWREYPGRDKISLKSPITVTVFFGRFLTFLPHNKRIWSMNQTCKSNFLAPFRKVLSEGFFISFVIFSKYQEHYLQLIYNTMFFLYTSVMVVSPYSFYNATIFTYKLFSRVPISSFDIQIFYCNPLSIVILTNVFFIGCQGFESLQVTVVKFEFSHTVLVYGHFPTPSETTTCPILKQDEHLERSHNSLPWISWHHKWERNFRIH